MYGTPSAPSLLPSSKWYEKIDKLCENIEALGWSLNPGRYVGVADRPQEDFDFMKRIEELNEELEVLNSEARELEE